MPHMRGKLKRKETCMPNKEILSVCVFCGSSNEVNNGFIDLATRLGQKLASEGFRMVYGGGGVGLMGACARAAHEAGGDVLGIMPEFLLQKEQIFEDVEHRIVDDMRIRKQMMLDESDGFIVLPGGIGTLEEAVEILSWARLRLHKKPMVFLDEEGFWDPFFELMDHIIDNKFAPEEFRPAIIQTDTPETAIAALRDKLANLS